MVALRLFFARSCGLGAAATRGGLGGGGAIRVLTSNALPPPPPPPQPFVLNEAEIVESFVRGRGPGGQAINKNKSCVQLVHTPTGTRVSCQEHRDLTANRKTARRLLKDKLDLLENGPLSRIGKEMDKIRKRKAKARQRQRKGINAPGESQEGQA